MCPCRRGTSWWSRRASSRESQGAHTGRAPMARASGVWCSRSSLTLLLFVACLSSSSPVLGQEAPSGSAPPAPSEGAPGPSEAPAPPGSAERRPWRCKGVVGSRRLPSGVTGCTHTPVSFVTGYDPGALEGDRDRLQRTECKGFTCLSCGRFSSSLAGMALA
jgi:hypothetical protein